VDQDALTDLYVRGTPTNTLRVYERDLLYIAAWKATRFDLALRWPKTEATALAFLLDHARDLSDAAPEDHARQTAETLIAQGLRKSLACPAPCPEIRPPDHPGRAGAAADHLPGIPRRDCRDRAILMLGWASGGRRRSEITGLQREDVSMKGFDTSGVAWLSLLETKTTQKGGTPRLVLKGRAAQALMHWVEVGGIKDGPLFRPISKADRVLKRRLPPDAIAQIVKHRLKRAGLPEGFASPHGLRSGFLTQDALDGAPIQAAIRLSLHRSMAKA